MLDDLEQLKDVRRQKLEALRGVGARNDGGGGGGSGGGEQAYRAAGWLANNRENFRRRVYDPLMVTVDVSKAEDAVYIENSVATRDLIALATEVQ